MPTGANETKANPGSPVDPRTYFAEERTFLAWIRTGIALMGFGFVVARFGLFLRELSSLKTLPKFESTTISVPLGTALLFGGVAVNILSCYRHVRIVRAMNMGEQIGAKPSTMGIIVALSLAAAGLAMAIYLARELAAN
jgi:putative membrane protein